MLVAVGLEASAAIGELPTARDDDHPDEVQRGNGASDAHHRHEPGALDVDVVQGNQQDDYLEGSEAKREDEFRPAPESGALFVANPGNDDDDLNDDKKYPPHSCQPSDSISPKSKP